MKTKNLLHFCQRTALMLYPVVATAITASAYDFAVDGIYYQITSDNEVAVTYGTSSWTPSYSGDEVIPETVTYNGTTYSVTAIGEYAFCYCSDLTSVTIPGSVTAIGYGAFAVCIGLHDVYSYVNPRRVSMGNDVFYLQDEYYYGRTLHVLPYCLQYYQENSKWNQYFWSIIELRNYDFEADGIYYRLIDASEVAVTHGTNKYTGDVVIPEVVTFNDNTFSVTTIGRNAFSDCRDLTSVVIPNSVTSIGIGAFEFCSSLTDISINNSVTSIEAYAFNGCESLTNIFIPGSVNSIGNGAFSNCTGLLNIVVADDNPTFDSRENCNAIISSDSNTLLYGCQNTVIPNTVTCIGERAFSNCSGLTEIIIPNSVTSFGYEAFYHCTGLTNILIPNSVTSIGLDAFEGCSGLTSVTIPNSITTITSGAFRSCTGLKSVIMPNSVKEIESEVFTGCIALESVNIPSSVTTIGKQAFYGCRSLTSVTIPVAVTSIGLHAFYGCSALTQVRSLAVTPPSISSNTFDSNSYAGVLEVLEGSIDAYRSHPNWGQFQSIQPIVAEAGDLDGDGKVTIGDVTDLIDLLLNGGASAVDYPSADMDSDGILTIADVTDIIDMLLRN